ncbi:MAG: GIY-YIG nuclease family protein [Flavobacterium sp.]|nr:GIY-YIG nuclease family protein [Flavobacterium sp.]
MYTIIDIATTGGPFEKEGITAIVLSKHNGHEIVDQFISLVNPEIPIQPLALKMSGINNEMLQSAPKFFEVAKRIIEMTDGCVLVAHNADFKYRILRTEFHGLGYDFAKRTLCTMELGKRLLPEHLPDHLNNFVRALEIPVADIARSSGEAMPTEKLFQALLDKDQSNVIINELIKDAIQKGITPKLRDILEGIPSGSGVYYIYNAKGKLIYIGKSRNIKKRINQHFTGTSTKCKKIQTEVTTVTYEETGSELIALLKESDEIKSNKPIYNRAQRKSIFQFALYAEKDENGYLNLKLQKADGLKKEITSFASLAEGKNVLFKITSQYRLCQKFTGLYQTQKECFQYTIKECDGACIGHIMPEEYNRRVQEFIDSKSFEANNMLLHDCGRNSSEQSVILIENGIYKGYAYYDLKYPVTQIEMLKDILIPMQNNRDTKNIIQGYLRKGKLENIVHF